VFKKRRGEERREKRKKRPGESEAEGMDLLHGNAEWGGISRCSEELKRRLLDSRIEKPPGLDRNRADIPPLKTSNY
jgi:hypothetical protein